jgi:hypothetical protein
LQLLRGRKRLGGNQDSLARIPLVVNPTIALCYAWELRTGLRTIASPNANAALNIPLPELDQKEKLKVVSAALNEGLLRIYRRSNKTELSSNSQEQAKWLETALKLNVSAREVPLLALTARGGRHWESIARPDWSNFLTEGRSVDYHDTVWISLQSGSYQLAEKARELVSRHFQNGKRGCCFVRPLDNWRPVYWKRLSSGHELWMDTGIASKSPQGSLLDRGLAMGNELAARELSAISQEWSSRLWLELRQHA